MEFVKYFFVITCLIAFVKSVRRSERRIFNPLCRDRWTYKDCYFYTSLGYCKTHAETLKKNCARSCNLCDMVMKEKPDYCVDNDGRSDCKFLKQNGACYTHEHLMRERCAKTCRLCDSRTKCKNMKCPPNKICVLNKKGEASCECPRHCPFKSEYKKLGKVCASNGKTYKDYCHMLHHSCRENSNLTVAFYGMCKSDEPCEDSKLERDSGTCEAWKKLGLCKDKFYISIMQKYCKRTCEMCPEERVPFPSKSCHSSPYGCCWNYKTRPEPGKGKCPRCENRYPDLCANFVSQCSSIYMRNKNFMRKNCPATCGYCRGEKLPEIELHIIRGNDGQQFIKTKFRKASRVP